MGKLGIALDLGTSGFRGQAINLENGGEIISTAVTTRHPLPGANVIDHLHFALEVGVPYAHQLIISAVNRVIDTLGVDKKDIVRLAVCGNPIQLSLFQEIEIRDLAYAGKRKLEALGVTAPERNAVLTDAKSIEGLDLPLDVHVLIPPSVQHEIGADALAMMIQTDILNSDKICVVTDYGTNNEMALIVNGTVYTGSTAAGPALEGQHIEHGLLALPGAISDVNVSGNMGSGFSCVDDVYLQTSVLDKNMRAVKGDTVHPVSGKIKEAGKAAPVGITGTGVVALISEGINSDLIRLPKINTEDGMIVLPKGIRFTQKDLLEAGKAIGAVRAGHITLCQKAGISLGDIEVAYCSGASGTYVDALKAQQIGMIPSGVKEIYQVGNTSLAMARQMAINEKRLWEMTEIADRLRQDHIMFAASKVFEKVYILEISFWTEGMPFTQYQRFLKKYGYSSIEEVKEQPKVIKTVERDIPDLGYLGLKIIEDIGQKSSLLIPECTEDMLCVNECPENALSLESGLKGAIITIDLALCNGVACMRCERICKEKAFDLIRLITGLKKIGAESFEN